MIQSKGKEKEKKMPGKYRFKSGKKRRKVLDFKGKMKKCSRKKEKSAELKEKRKEKTLKEGAKKK